MQTYSSFTLVDIINLTPDSFSDGGQFTSVTAVLAHVAQAQASGINWFDLGAESTRPGAHAITPDVEAQRLQPVLQALRASFPDLTLSVDTRKASVAHMALSEGADWINDVSGLQFDPAMAATVARHQGGVVIMHSQGTPDVMQHNPTYTDVCANVDTFLRQQATVALNAGVSAQRIILDPGFGFGKTLDHNLHLFRDLPRLCQQTVQPIWVGTSRKSFLTLGATHMPPNQRDPQTVATLVLCLQAGVKYFRVHQAATLQPTLALCQALLSG
jgi:dihydropteroate synthase